MLPNGLEQYYDEESQSIVILTNPEKIKAFLESRTSATWGQNWIGETSYFQLAVFSPYHAGDNQVVLVCDAERLAKAKDLDGVKND